MQNMYHDYEKLAALYTFLPAETVDEDAGTGSDQETKNDSRFSNTAAGN